MESAGALLLLLVFRSVSDRKAPLSLPFIGDLYQRYPDVARRTVLVYFCAGVTLFFLIRSLVLLLQLHLQYRTAHKMSADLSHRLLESYVRGEYALLLTRNSAELTRTAFEAVNIVATFCVIPLFIAGSEIFLTLGFITVLAVNAPVLTVLSIILTGTILGLTFRIIQPRLAVLGADHEHLGATVFRLMQQSIGGAREVRLFQSERYFIDEVNRERQRMAKGLSSQATLSSFPRILLETIFAIFILVFVGVAAMRNELNAETIAFLGLFAYIVLRIMPSLNRVSLAINNLRYGSAALNTVTRDLEVSKTIERRLPSSGQAIPLTDSIVIDNVSYHYPNHDEEVLRGVSLKICRGESIGLVGSTGAGKSTLVDVVLGLLVPAQGRILVDGADIAEHRADWQRSLGVVSQTVFLLDDSLRRNIAFGIPDDAIDNDRIAEATTMAQLDQFVSSLPDGLETPVGERGARLSGGQKQRVAIARALYRRPDVVVFDEGTSALDSLTEAEVIAALDRLRGDRTLIMVAHRLTTVRRCDRIVLLDSGAVAATGSYDELLDRSDSFRRMAL